MKKVRHRYIVFRVIGDAVGKNDVVRAINRAFDSRDGGDRFWLVYFKDNLGMLQCLHTTKEHAIKVLNGITVLRIQTLGTSGTMRSGLSKFAKRGVRI